MGVDECTRPISSHFSSIPSFLLVSFRVPKVVGSVVVASWEVSERRWRGSGGGGGGDGGETLRLSLSQGAR